MNRFRLFVCVALIAGLMSCSGPPATPTAVEPATTPTRLRNVPTPVIHSPAENTPGADNDLPFTPTPTYALPDLITPQAHTAMPGAPSPTPSGPLPKDGPWLAYRNPQGGVSVAGPQGENPQPAPLQLDPQAGMYKAFAASPHGYISALHSGPINAQAWRLDLIHLPEMQIERSFELLAHPEAQASNTPESALAGVSSAVPCWSPDGNYLAFVAAIDGPSSDLYVWNAAQDELRRISDQPTQAGNFAWSPDGSWIVYEEVYSFFGPQVSSVWAAPMNGGPAIQLYEPESASDQVFLGWTGPDSLVSYDSGLTGIRNLRQVNLTSGEVTILLAYGLRPLALDPNRGTVLLSSFPATNTLTVTATLEAQLPVQAPAGVEPTLALSPVPTIPPTPAPSTQAVATNVATVVFTPTPVPTRPATVTPAPSPTVVYSGPTTSLYILAPGQTEPSLVTDALSASPRAKWLNEPGVFMTDQACPSETGQNLAIMATGDVTCIEPPTTSDPATDACWIARSQPSQLPSASQSAVIPTGPSYWRPDGGGYYFMQGARLFFAASPEFTPQPVDLATGIIGWVTNDAQPGGTP